MPTTLLHGYTSFDHCAAGDVKKLPNWGANPAATVGSIVTPGLSGIGQAISAPSALAYQFKAGFDVAVCRVLFKPTAITTVRTILSFSLPDNAGVVALQLTAAGKLQLLLQQVTTPATYVSTDARTLVSGTVYAVEFGVYFNEGSGEARVLLDGVEDQTLHKTGLTSQSNTGTRIDRLILSDPDGVFDDFHCRVGNNGLRLTDFLSDAVGNPKFVTLFPSADGNYTGFLGASAGAHHLKVNETQADGDTTYLYCDQTLAVGTRESWTMGNMTVLPTRIYSITTLIFLKTDVSTELDLQQFLRYSSADYYAGEGELATTSYVFYGRQFDRSPAGETYWTKSEVNDAELGLMRAKGSGSFQDRVSQGVICAIYTDGALPSVTNPVTSAAQSMLRHSTHHLVSLFKVERLDGFQFFFTDHNASLSFLDDTYEPIKGVDATARRREVALKEQNVEIQGIISSEKITVDDLRAGRYRSAILTEYLVDWRFPWIGAFQRSIYLIQNVSFNGTSFVAQMAGLTSRLRHNIGDVYGRTCRYKVGDEDITGVLVADSHCKVPIKQLTYRSVRVSTVTDRRIFTANTADIPGFRPDDYFTFGEALWRTGANQGLAFPLKDYLAGTRQFEQQLPCPFAIQVNDLFDVAPGCNLVLSSDCVLKFNNLVNYGGYPFMTGTDQYLQTPSSSGNG